MQKLQIATLADGSIQFGFAIISANKDGNWVTPGGRETSDRAAAMKAASRMHRMMFKE